MGIKDTKINEQIYQSFNELWVDLEIGKDIYFVYNEVEYEIEYSEGMWTFYSDDIQVETFDNLENLLDYQLDGMPMREIWMEFKEPE